MSFSILSNELLTEIFLYLADEKIILCNISQCSRHLNSSVRRVLVHNVEFKMNLSGFEVFQLRLERFMHYLNKYMLSPAVHGLNVSLIYLGQSEELLMHRQINVLLRCLPNLVSLSIKRPGFNPTSVRTNRRSITGFQPNFSDFPLTQTLRYLELPASIITCQDLVKLMAFEHIESLYIHLLQTTTQTDSLEHSTSNLISLRLGDNHIPQATFLELLKIPRGLKKLHCTIPGLERDSSGRRSKRRMCESLSARTVSSTLMVVKHSLEELVVTDFETNWLGGQDDSISDFSMFLALKKLQIPSNCFFRTPYAHMNEMGISGIYRLLPWSLEELKIDFDYGRKVLTYEHGGQVHEEWQYEWLLEIASYKASSFPRLRFVHLEESSYQRMSRCRPLCRQTIAWEIPHTGLPELAGREFHPPEPLATAFIQAEIHCLAVLRAKWFDPSAVP